MCSVPGLAFAEPPDVTGVTSSGACTLTSAGLGGVVGCIMGIMDIVLGLLIAGGVLFTVYGAFQMIGSEEKREAGKQRIYHGIIGIFVMISIWGFVRILDNTFKLNKNALPVPQLRSSTTP